MNELIMNKNLDSGISIVAKWVNTYYIYETIQDNRYSALIIFSTILRGQTGMSF